MGSLLHGFGLKLVYQILTAHNGNIKYENILPHGLKVILEIPMNILIRMKKRSLKRTGESHYLTFTCS